MTAINRRLQTPPIGELVRRSLQGDPFVPIDCTFQIVRSLPHGQVAAVLGTVRVMELDRLIVSKRSRQRDLVITMIVAHLLDPSATLTTACGPEESVSSLGAVLDFGGGRRG